MADGLIPSFLLFVPLKFSSLYAQGTYKENFLWGYKQNVRGDSSVLSLLSALKDVLISDGVPALPLTLTEDCPYWSCAQDTSRD